MRIVEPTLPRRGFLKAALAAGAAPYFVPAAALGQDGRPAPSNRIVMGAIGMGGRGTGDMADFTNRRDAILFLEVDNCLIRFIAEPAIDFNLVTQFFQLAL